MGALLLGLAIGLAVGFVLGRREVVRRGDVGGTAAGSPFAAPRPADSVPLGAPTKRGRKAGLTEADFVPRDDILDRLRSSWDESGTAAAVATDLPTPEPAPEAAEEPVDPRLADAMRRVFARLEQVEPGKEEPTMAPPDDDAATAATVTEAVGDLAADGYGDDLRLIDGELHCGTCGSTHPTEAVEVDRVYRFEGPSDPADEAIVLGLRCPQCGAKGALVSAFGPDADPALAGAFVYLAARARHR